MAEMIDGRTIRAVSSLKKREGTKDDLWAAQASEHIRTFFKEVMEALRSGDEMRAENLMSHLSEPKETFLGISRGSPNGRGLGRGQSRQLILAMRNSRAFISGLLSDLSEMALYVEGVDRDKISDLTTNIIRELLVEYTQQQCDLYEIETQNYSGPSFWDPSLKNWRSHHVQLPYIDDSPVILVPKYIVRRKLSIDSQEFYNKQITDFLIAENLRANSSLVQTIKGKKVVTKSAVREQHPKTKSYIADMVADHPDLLELYKSIATRHKAMMTFADEEISIHALCLSLADAFLHIKAGKAEANEYHRFIMGALTALFYPDLIQPHKKWEIHDGRKRIDIVYTNSSESGFFAQRRNDPMMNANTVIVECKNYSADIANPEFDQLLGRFDNNRGKFGIITCRSVDNQKLVDSKCKDASSRGRGYIIVLTDSDIIEILRKKAALREPEVGILLFQKFRKLLE